MKRIAGGIAALTLLVSCGNDNRSIEYNGIQCDVTENLSVGVLNDSFSFGGVSCLLEYDSLLIIHDPMQEYQLQFFNKETGCHVAQAGRLGQAANELANPANMTVNPNTGIFSIYDRSRRDLLSCRLTDLPGVNAEDWFSISLPEYQLAPTNVVLVGNDRLVAMHGKPRFTISRGGEVIAMYDELPLLEDNQVADDPVVRMLLLSSSLWAVKPDGCKMVQATTVGSVMEILDIDEESITSAVMRYYQKPIFSEVKGQIAHLPETIYGFACLQATDNYIYATIHGVANPTVYPSDIYVFDWQGNVVKRLSADCQISCFVVDGSDTIYAIVIGSDGEQHLARLSRQ